MEEREEAMETFEPEMVVFCCQNSVDERGTEAVRREYGGQVRIVRMPCSGKTDVRYLLKAFESDADGVLIVGCPEGACRSLDGNFRAKKRVGYVRSLLEEIGFGGDRIEMVFISPSTQEGLSEGVRAMIEKIEEIGPNPVKKAKKNAHHGDTETRRKPQ